jgi:hypothetical protein
MKMDALPRALSVLLIPTCTVFAGCSGTTPAAEAPPVSARSSAEPATPAPVETTSATPETSAAPPPETPDTAKEPAAATETTPPAGKNITYRMTSGGLVAELDGVVLEPKALPVRVGKGWGVKLVVAARATDDREHHLLNPSQGPLMVAEQIERGGKKEVVPDERKGDGELTLDRSGTHLERELRKPIAAGESLTLYVGLWGLGTSADDRKPIKKLFVVKMVGGAHKPEPVVTAPE